MYTWTRPLFVIAALYDALAKFRTIRHKRHNAKAPRARKVSSRMGGTRRRGATAAMKDCVEEVLLP